jgi:hypothetical protein
MRSSTHRRTLLKQLAHARQVLGPAKVLVAAVARDLAALLVQHPGSRPLPRVVA